MHAKGIPSADLPAIFNIIKPRVAAAIRVLCRRAGRPAVGDDGVIYEACSAALEGFNPSRGDLEARVVFFARRTLDAEMTEACQSLTDDEGIDIEVAGGVDPAVLLEALEQAAGNPAWVACQLSHQGTHAAARELNVSLRTAQRWSRSAAQQLLAGGGKQQELF